MKAAPENCPHCGAPMYLYFDGDFTKGKASIGTIDMRRIGLSTFRNQLKCDKCNGVVVSEDYDTGLRIVK